MFMAFKRITDRVYTTRYLHNNKYDSLLNTANLLEKALVHYHTLVDFGQDVNIALCGMNSLIDGIYDPNTKYVEVNYRYTGYSLLSVVSHELVHAEQYHQGRLITTRYKNGYKYMWEGRESFIEDGSYHTVEWPWEREANDRQDGLSLVICDELNI